MKFAYTLVAIAGVANAAVATTVKNFDPNDVSADSRKQWCLSQTSSCPLICSQLPGSNNKPKENTCDSDDLSYSCICSNGNEPNASEYSQTIPYYVCTEENNACVKKCPDNNGDCQYKCRAEHPCGARNPKRSNATATATGTATLTSAATTSTTSGAIYTGMAGDSTTDSGAMSPVYGYAVLLAGFLGGFAAIM